MKNYKNITIKKFQIKLKERKVWEHKMLEAIII